MLYDFMRILLKVKNEITYFYFENYNTALLFFIFIIVCIIRKKIERCDEISSCKFRALRFAQLLDRVAQVCQWSLFTRETEIWILSRDCDDSSVVFENMQRLCVRHDHGRFVEAIEPRLWACVTSLSTCRWSRRTCMAVYFVIMFKKKRLLSCLMYTSLMKFYQI